MFWFTGEAVDRVDYVPGRYGKVYIVHLETDIALFWTLIRWADSVGELRYYTRIQFVDTRSLVRLGTGV